MIKQSYEATLARSITSRRQNTGAPSMTVKAVKDRKLPTSRTRKNRNPDDAHKESTGNGEQADNGRSTEVPFGGSCKSASPEVQIPAVHTTYASLAKERAARKTEYEEKMLNFRQSLTNSRLKQSRSTQEERQSVGKSYSVQYKTKPRKKSVVILGLQRQTNGDLFVASLSAKTGASILEKRLVGSQGYLLSAKNDNSVYNVSSIETGSKSNDLTEHTQGNDVAKYISSHCKPSANITSNPKTDGIDLCKENLQGNFGLESRSKQQNQTDVVGSRLTPKDSKINADIADTVQARNSYRDKENGARAQKLIETLDKVNKESRYEDLDLAVSHHNIGTRFNPLNRNLETAGLENLLHELETTLETLQQGQSPKGLELSSHLEALRKSSRVTAPSVHSIRSRTGAHQTVMKNEINKRQAGSPNSLPFPAKSNKTQPVASSSQGSRRPHLKKSTPSKQGFRADDETKYLDENHDSVEGLQRRILLAKFNRKPPREETADKVSAIVSPITGAVSEPPSLGQSESSVALPMGTGHSKTAPPGDSNQILKRDTPISVDTKNKRIVVNSKDTRVESEKNTLNPNSTRTGNTNLDVEDSSNLTRSVKNRLDSKNDLISRNSETKDSSKKSQDKASGLSHLQTANHKSLKSGVKFNANWQVSESLAPSYVNDYGEQETGKDNLDKETKLREKETSLDVLDNSSNDNDKDVNLTRNNEEPESQKAESGDGEKAEDNSGNKNSFPYTQEKSTGNNPTPSNEKSLDFNEDQQIETSENSTSNEINFHNTKGISTEHNDVHVETPAESNGFQQNETLQELKSRENTTAEPARTDSDIDIGKAAAQKRDEQRKISAAISRGGTTGGMGSTSVPSLLSQPLPQSQQQQQQQQQQHQQLPLVQLEQPQFPGVVPTTSLAYAAEPIPVNGNTHTGNPQIVNGNIHYSGQSNHTTYPLNSENNTALPALRDGSLYNQVSTQLFSHGVDVDTPRYDSESPTNRKRREGRDHTNWAPPPNFRGLLRESLDLGTMPGENAVVSTTNSNYYNNNNRDRSNEGFVAGDGAGEEGLQLIVLDKTDDEDDETIHPPFGNLDTGRYATNRSDSDVFPADKRAVERDLFQQEYSPTSAKPELYNNARKISRNGFVSLNNNLAARTNGPQTLRGRQLTVHGDNFRQVPESYLASDTNRSRSANDGILGLNLPQESIDTHNNVPSTVRIDAFSIDSNRTVDFVQAGTHPTQSHFEQIQGQGQGHGHGHVPPFIYNVTDFDSQQTTERSTYRNPDVASSNISTHNPFQILQRKQMTLPHQSNPTAPPHPSTSQLHPSSHNHTQLPEVTSKVQQRHQRVPPAPPPPVFAISQVDYERFTSVPPGISTVREEIGRGDTSRKLKVPDDRTFVLHPDLGTMVPGPGYKFLVDRQFIQKRASRANVLTRAERLLNARRGHLTDRSDSSDDMTRKAADDDDDEDELTDMEGLRHKALRHVNRRQRKVYEDSASSDDVLHTIRYKTRGPLTVAARRARLTSFNARVNKQKRVRAARRQVGIKRLKMVIIFLRRMQTKHFTSIIPRAGQYIPEPLQLLSEHYSTAAYYALNASILQFKHCL